MPESIVCQASHNGWPILTHYAHLFLTFKTSKQLYFLCCACQELLLCLHLGFITILKLNTAKLRSLISKLCLNNGWGTPKSSAFTKLPLQGQLWHVPLQEQNGAIHAARVSGSHCPRLPDRGSKLTFHLWGENHILSPLHHTNHWIYYFPRGSIRKLSMCILLASITFLEHLYHSNINLEFWILDSAQEGWIGQGESQNLG